MPKPDEYRCSACGHVFTKRWSDDDAMDEMSKTFPGVKISQCVLVCDDCFKKIKLLTTPGAGNA
jgi:hypothetical protein